MFHVTYLPLRRFTRLLIPIELAKEGDRSKLYNFSVIYSQNTNEFLQERNL